MQSSSYDSPSSSSPSSSSSYYSSDLTSFTQPDPHFTAKNSIDHPNIAFKRSKAIQELLETESNYSSDLIVIRDIYLHRSTGPPPSAPPLSLSDRQIIFSNVSQIAHLAQSLASELVIANEKGSIGQCFIQFLPRIEKLYTIYCSKYDAANKKLEQFNRKISSKQKKLHFSSPTHTCSNRIRNDCSKPNNEHPGIRYMRECKSLTQGRTSAWDLGSLLIKPVQRCLKYSLLLDQIIKFTELDHPDRQNLILARDGMSHVADKINEAKRRNELVGEMISRIGPIGVIYPAVRLNSNNKWNTPAELSKLIQQVKQSTKALNRLPGDIRNSEYSVKNWILSADRLTDAFKATFLLKNNNIGLEPNSSPGVSNIDVSDLRRYQHLVLLGALNAPLKYLHEQIETEMIPKIIELKELYTKPMMLIEKYERRKNLIMMSGMSGYRTSAETSSPRSSQSSSIQSAESTPNQTSSTTSNENNSPNTISNKISELEQVEDFLLDQLPKLVRSGALALNLILANLAHSFKLFHSDVIILIKKVVFKT